MQCFFRRYFETLTGGGRVKKSFSFPTEPEMPPESLANQRLATFSVTRDEEAQTQIAIYDDGVGTSSFKPLAILGGVLAGASSATS